MPYIAITTEKEFTAEEKHRLSKRLGELITLIPGKTAEQTMISFQEKCFMFMEGKKSPLFFLRTDLYGKAPLESKQNFVKELFLLLHEDYGIPTENIYINIAERENWGTGGTLK